MAKTKKDHDKEIDAFKQAQTSSDPLDTVFQPIQQTALPSETAHLERLIEEVYSTRNIQLKTELSSDQVMIVSQMEVFASKYKSPVMKLIAKVFKEHNVSLKRKGKQEFIEISKAFQPPAPELAPEPKSRLLGR